jgi:cell division septal protein FtsQ
VKDAINPPVARSWRDIPQNVKPRAMSREGRRRLKLRVLRAAAGAGVLGLVAWGGWEVAAALQIGPTGAASAGKMAPVRDLLLSTDGVLDRAWLARTLALPKNATLMDLDLGRLRARLLASGQARTAAIVRKFPAALAVSISERSPVARILTGAGGTAPPVLLVARDGVAYEGAGYDPAMVASLPWLDGVTLKRRDGGYAPIEGMDTVAALLSRAQLDAEPIYRTWQTVSLGKLESDGEIGVQTRDGLKVIFGTQEDFFRQLARLDLLLDAAADKPDQVVREINLSLGGQVSVAVGPAPAPQDSPTPAQPQFKFHIN